MRLSLLFFYLLFFLVGCDNEKIIKMDGTHYIKCEGVDRTDGTNLIVTIRKDNVVVEYTGVTVPSKSLIVAKTCLIY